MFGLKFVLWYNRFMKLNEVNLNLLKTFYNVAKEGNITKTAEKYFTSQPAISRAIKQLEEVYNAQLFYRAINGVELTEKGKVLFSAVEKIFETINQTENDIKQLDSIDIGSITIGVPSQIGAVYLFEAISKFHKLYPNIEITIVSKTTTELLNQLKKHELNFVIDTAPVRVTEKNIEVKPIKEFENCFFVNNKFPLSKIEKISNLTNLQEYPIILPIPNTANRRALDEVLKSNKVTLNNIINIHTSEMIISAVKKDAGIGYVMKDLILDDLKNGELLEIKVKQELPKIEICLVYENGNLTNLSKYFLTKFLEIKV